MSVDTFSVGSFAADQALLAALERDYQASTPDAHLIATQLVKAKKQAQTKTKKGKKPKPPPAPPPKQTDLAMSITSIAPDLMKTGASTLTVTILDPYWHLLDSGFFDTDEDGNLDDLDINYPENTLMWWRLHQVSVQAGFLMTLTFIPRLVAKLMALKGPVKVARSKKTRAEFIQSLVLKVKDESPSFVSHELHKKQPIAKVGAAMLSAPSVRPLAAPAPAAGGGGGNVWEVRCSQEASSSGNGWTELSNNGNAAARLGIPRTASGSGGWDFSTLGHMYPRGTMLKIKAPNGRSGTFPLTDVGDGSSFAPAIGLTPAVTSALGGLPATVQITMADGSDIHPKYPGMAKLISGSGGFGVSSGAGAGPAGSNTRTVVQPYQFEVQPGEDYWTAMNRLAQEVGWELICVGSTIYYDSDTTLITQPRAAIINRSDQTVLDWSYDWENRHIATNMSLKLACGMFEFHAGEVLLLRGFGAASTGSTAKSPGSWLIGEIARDAGAQTSVFTLVQPTKPKAEPAPQTTTVASSGAGGGGSGGTTVGAKGFANPAPDSTTGRLDMGRDGNYSGKGAFALFSGTCHVIPGGPGWPGEGDYIWIRNDDQSGQWKAVYYAEGARAIVHDGQHVNAADKIGVPVAHGGTGAYGNFEIGPANPTNGDCAVKQLGLGSSAARQLVMDWEKLLTSLGMPPTNSTVAAGRP